MKVGLFGGSFNPPHKGHLHISNLAVKKLALHQIWWIPTAKNNFKDASIYESYESRYQKCLKLTSGLPKAHIKKFNDIKTETLIRKLQKKYPSHEFVWIMGADNLQRFHEWDHFKNLIRLIPFAIFSREKELSKISQTKSFTLYTKLKTAHKKLPNFLTFRTKTLDISSTKIRENDKANI